jgi:hypothetical protein
LARNGYLLNQSVNALLITLRIQFGRCGQGLFNFNRLRALDTAIAVSDVNGVQGNGGTIDSVGVVIAGEKLLINSGYDSFGGAGEYQAGTGNTLFILTLPQ